MGLLHECFNIAVKTTQCSKIQSHQVSSLIRLFFFMIPGTLSFPISSFLLALQHRVFVEIFTFVAPTVHPRKLGWGSSSRAASASRSAISSMAFSWLVGVAWVRGFPAGPEIAGCGLRICQTSASPLIRTNTGLNVNFLRTDCPVKGEL